MLDILLVEDDVDLATGIIDYFELEGIQCDHAVNGVIALNLIEQHAYQVVILDLNLPVMSGLSVCQKMRENAIDIPVLMLTAMDTLGDKIRGFEQGADDYLVKPFAIEELLVRVNALSKRRSGQVSKLNVAGIVLDLKQARAMKDNQPLKLSPTELKILESLMRSSPNPVSKESLETTVWGDKAPESNSLKVHIYNIRKQLRRAGSKDILFTIANVGFAIVEPPEESL